MSSGAVQAFYRELECDPVLREEALGLKKDFSSQEKLIRAFIALGARQGFHFTREELVQHIFVHGQTEQ